MILRLDRPIVFANYSLGEAEVSRTTAAFSDDTLLFVVGNKVHFAICIAGTLLLRGQKGAKENKITFRLCCAPIKVRMDKVKRRGS